MLLVLVTEFLERRNKKNISESISEVFFNILTSISSLTFCEIKLRVVDMLHNDISFPDTWSNLSRKPKLSIYLHLKKSSIIIDNFIFWVRLSYRARIILLYEINKEMDSCFQVISVTGNKWDKTFAPVMAVREFLAFGADMGSPEEVSKFPELRRWRGDTREMRAAKVHKTEYHRTSSLSKGTEQRESLEICRGSA